MHAVFMVYGVKHAVDHLFMDMQAQKFPLRLYKEGEKDKIIWMQGGLRYSAFGVWEYVFPKEAIDEVLTTLNFDNPPYKQYQGLKMNLVTTFIRKMIRCKKPGKFKNDKKLLWMKEHLAIFPIGIREDTEFTEVKGENVGWSHEAI